MKETKFKQTELGPIPQEWDVKNINKTCTIKARIGWQGLKSNEYLESGDYLLVTGTDFENGFINWKTCSYVSEWRFKQDKNIQIRKGDVLITKDGTIGKVAFLNEIPQEGTLNSGVFVVRPKNSDEINSIFLSLVFKSFWFDDFLEQITSGSTIVHLYQKDFTKFNFPLPSKPEQTAIATVLSDIDAVISTTEKLIAKKKALKQGAMQTLLSGKMRIQNGKWTKTTHFKQTELGPIPQEWEVEKLSQICDRFLDGDWIEADDQSSEGIRLIQTGNIGNGQYLDKANRKHFISVATFKRLNCTEIFEGDVLVSRLPDPVGRACILPKSHERRITAVDCTIIHFSNYNPVLFVNYTQTSAYQNAVNECLSGSTRLRISRKNLGEMLIPVPPTKEEQTAIATVLSDMDSEIAALETKLAKYRQLKTGMMQQLLTGKVRLVDSAETASENQSKHSVPLSFKRSVLAAEIADRLCDEPTFGHVKMEKMLFLTEKMCNIDIDSSYHRDAAGPFDNRGLHSIDSQLAKQKWFKAVKQDKGYRYAPLEKRGGHKQYFERYFSDRLSVFNNIINIFKTANTEQCEIVATLYSAWEDFLKQGISPTDEQIVTEVLTNWHKSKERISKNRWLKALLWMKDHEFIPEVGEKIK